MMTLMHHGPRVDIVLNGEDILVWWTERPHGYVLASLDESGSWRWSEYADLLPDAQRLEIERLASQKFPPPR